ncbi:LADA_0E10682g1_1 [Lachancea dasiensis]|uniref:Conserved oligomeric Golgi complex subunit 6 n=1 Tax=Lachancea dasiensis TaxID=1072105 RepID=A0A1G4JEA2_9SACH|nr:LADA_0E10682g1_1 [Lachancea dasiensis]
MDFLDYQTYALGDSSENDNQLPEPASRLKFQSQRSFVELDKPFTLPSSKPTEFINDNNGTLQEKMQRYASMSLDQLGSAATSLLTGADLPVPFGGALPRDGNLKQLLESSDSTPNSADSLLSKKLSRVLGAHGRPSSISAAQLEKSFMILEDNRENLNFHSQAITRPDFVGSLARKSLRSALENELLRSHLTLIEDIQPIVGRIKRLTPPITTIKHISDEILHGSSCNKKDSALNMEGIYALRKKMKELQLQKQLLSIIREKLTLTQVEEEALINAPIDTDFFEVVNKLMRIKETSSHLLALENPKAGQSLLQQTNMKLSGASKRIYNYLINFFYDLQSASKTFGERAFASDDRSLINFQKSMIYMSNDLPLFNEVLKKIVRLRSQRVLDDFLSQFDVDPSKNSRPIVMSAHDPVRYLGDVLAHVHSLIVDEADFMNSMFKFQDLKIEGTPKSVLQENGDYLNGLGTNLLNETFKPAENSIRIRLEQIIRFEDDPSINFDICELLKLYQMMFIKYGIDPEGSFIRQLNTLKNNSGDKVMSGLLTLMNEHVPEEKIGLELLPSDWLLNYMTNLCKILSKIEKSGNAETSNYLIESDFLQKTLDTLIIERLPQYYQTHFPLAKKDKEEKVKLLIFEINSLDLILTRLLPFGLILDGHESGCRKELQNAIKTLVTLESGVLLERLGMDIYSNLLNMIFPIDSVEDELDYDMYLPVSENPIMKIETIRANVYDKLNGNLPNLNSDVQDALVLNVVSPTIADEIANSCFKNLSKFYKVFRETLVRLYPNSIDDIFSILNFTSEDFDTIVGVV